MQRIDDIDKAILALLKKNAKLSNKEIAAEIGLSITPVFERIKRMERNGVIKGYSIRVDKSQIERGLRVLCQVSLKEHKDNQIQLFEEEVRHLSEVTECLHLAGNIDYLLSVEVKDIEAYEYFVKQKLAKLSNISNVQSSFVLGTLIERD